MICYNASPVILINLNTTSKQTRPLSTHERKLDIKGTTEKFLLRFSQYYDIIIKILLLLI